MINQIENLDQKKTKCFMKTFSYLPVFAGLRGLCEVALAWGVAFSIRTKALKGNRKKMKSIHETKVTPLSIVH